MAQEYRVVKAGFFKHADSGIEADLSRGSDDGALYLNFQFPSNEHGKKGRPKSMKLENWETLVNNADVIQLGCQKARQSEAGLKLFEAHKAQSEQEFAKLNGARTDMPDVITDAVYAKKSAEIKAKYPDVFPVEAPEETEAPVGNRK